MGLLEGWMRFYDGQQVANLDTGNTSNAPGDPPVQEGNYQFIQDELYFDPAGVEIGDNYTGGDMMLTGFDLSGNAGGGFSFDDPPDIPPLVPATANPKTGVIAVGEGPGEITYGDDDFDEMDEYQ